MLYDSETYYHTTANGSRIFIEECGSGPLMVLMHGLGGTTNAFQPLIKHFAHSYTMLRFDFPGSGLSTFETLPSIPQFVEDLNSILGCRKSKELPILVGHSLGSIVAMHYATEYDVKRMVLIGPGRSMAHIPAAVTNMTGLAAKAREGIAGIRDTTITNNVAPKSTDLVRTIVRQMISSQTPEGYAATCEVLCGESHVDPDYGEIECPTLLVAGDQDKISPLSRSEDLKMLIGGKDRDVLLKVVHSGHQQVLEDTEGVANAMKYLLSSLSK